MYCASSVAAHSGACQRFRSNQHSRPSGTQRVSVIVKSGFKPEVDSSRPRAPDAPPAGTSSSSFNPPPPAPPPTPSTSAAGLAPTKRELLFFAGGSVLGGLAHAIYTNKTTLSLTDPAGLENLFREAILEEEILETKDMVVKLEAVLEQMDDRLAEDEEAIRKGKTDDGRDLDAVREEAQNLRTDRGKMLMLRDEMKNAVTEMTQALAEYKATKGQL